MNNFCQLCPLIEDSIVLYCQHSFCLNCLVSQFDKNKETLDCPICGEVSDLNEEAAQALEQVQNYLMEQQLINRQKQFSQQKNHRPQGSSCAKLNQDNSFFTIKQKNLNIQKNKIEEKVKSSLKSNVKLGPELLWYAKQVEPSNQSFTKSPINNHNQNIQMKRFLNVLQNKKKNCTRNFNRSYIQNNLNYSKIKIKSNNQQVHQNSFQNNNQDHSHTKFEKQSSGFDLSLFNNQIQKKQQQVQKEFQELEQIYNQKVNFIDYELTQEFKKIQTFKYNQQPKNYFDFRQIDQNIQKIRNMKKVILQYENNQPDLFEEKYTYHFKNQNKISLNYKQFERQYQNLIQKSQSNLSFMREDIPIQTKEKSYENYPIFNKVKQSKSLFIRNDMFNDKDNQLTKKNELSFSFHKKPLNILDFDQPEKDKHERKYNVLNCTKYNPFY